VALHVRRDKQHAKHQVDHDDDSKQQIRGVSGTHRGNLQGHGK